MLKYLDVPVSGPKIYPEDIQLVHKAVDEGWFTEGKHCARFARKLEQFTGFKHCVLCNSGSSANLLAIATALCLSTFRTINDAKREIITCATGFPTTIYPIVQNGSVPLFVDIDLETLNIDMERTETAMLENNTAGIIVAHTLGFPFDEKRMADRAHYWGMFLIADCSDALGAMVDGKHVGMFSDMATFSFFPAHHICCGEGGAVCTNDDTIAEMLRKLSNWGRDCHCLPGQDNSCGHRFDEQYGDLPFGYDHKYVFSEIGYNLKMTELQGALGYAQMAHIEEFVQKRQMNCAEMWSAISNFDKKFLMIRTRGKISPFGFPLLLKEQYSARDLATFLQECGVASRPIFAGNMLRQPVIWKMGKWRSWGEMENSDYVMEHGLWIGLHPALSNEQIQHSIDVLNEYVES